MSLVLKRCGRGSLWIAGCMLAVAVTMATAGNPEFFEYIHNGDEITVTKYNGPGGDIVIPDFFDGKPVTIIGERAFHRAYPVYSIVIPDTVRRIEFEAFYYCSLVASLTLPSSLEYIGRGAFHYWSSLTRITIPDGVTYIGNEAFRNALSLTEVNFRGDGKNPVTIKHSAFRHCPELKRVVLPPDLTRIEAETFSFCFSLTDIALPDGLISIGGNAFRYCSSLRRIDIPATVTEFGIGAFDNCGTLEAVFCKGNAPWYGSIYKFFDGSPNVVVYYLPGTSGWGPVFSERPTSLLYPDGDLAYVVEDHDSITITGYIGEDGTLVLPSEIDEKTVTRLDATAFSENPFITSVAIPATVIEIEPDTFRACLQLTNFYVAAENPMYSSHDGVLFHDGEDVVLFQYPAGRQGAYSMPDIAAGIRDHAFYRSLGLTGVTVPDGVLDVAGNAFQGCTALRWAQLGSGLGSVGEQAFAACTDLEWVHFHGDAPQGGPTVFDGTPDVVCYYTQGMSGWETLWSDRPTAQWPAEFLFTVRSDHGVPEPPVGIYSNVYGTVLTNSVGAETVIVDDLMKYIAAGWTMPRHEPSAGEGDQFEMTVENSAVLTWLWSTNTFLEVVPVTNGWVNWTNQWLAAGSEVTIEAFADAHHHFVGWRGDTNGCVIDGSQLTALMDQGRRIEAVFAIDTYRLQYAAGSNGTIEGEEDQTVAHGSDGTPVTARPDVGHHFTQWSDGGTEAWRQETNVTADLSVTASFAPKPCRWTVASAHGTPDPAAGVYTQLYGTVMTFEVDALVEGVRTQYVCRGWTLHGHEPATGSGNQFTVTVTNDADLVWNWQTQVWFRAERTGSFAEFNNLLVRNGWYDQGTTAAASALASAGYRFLRWGGDVPAEKAYDNPVQVPLDRSRILSAHFTNVVSFQVESAQGGSVPPVGTTIHDWGTVIPVLAVTNSPLVVDGAKHVTSGWIGSGAVPESGASTNVGPVTLTNDSTIVWQWDTSYWLEPLAGAGGSINVSNQWVPSGSGIPITATPDANHHLVEWTGDTSGCPIDGAQITAIMNRPRTITAVFAIDTYTLTYIAGPGGGIEGESPQTVAHGESGTFVSAVADPGYSFTQWSDGVLTAGRRGLNVTHDITVTAWFAPNPHTLTVASAHGEPDPAIGVHTNLYGTLLTNTVDAVVTDGGTQYVNTGWTLAGHDAAAGSSNRFTMTVTNDAVLTWQWTTNYWLETASSAYGWVSTASQWVPAGTTAIVPAHAQPYYHFTNWSGTVAGDDIFNPSLNLLMNGPKTVEAHFAPNVTTNTATPEYWLALHGFTNFVADAVSDPLGKGMQLWEEYIAGTDPADAKDVFVVISHGCAADGARFSFYGRTGRVYRVTYAEDISHPLPWEALPDYDGVNGADAMIQVTDPDSGQCRYYRVAVRLDE